MYKRSAKLFLIFLVCIMLLFGFYYLKQSDEEAKKADFSDLEVKAQNASYVILGASYIIVPQNATVVTQVDRVIRDIASHYKTDVSPDHKPKSYKELVPWMEGARVAELMKYADVKVIPAANVPCKKINGIWYGPDEKGNFIFEVDPSKVTPYRCKIKDPNTRIQIDTHGMNVLVPAAIKNKAFLVVGCGDLSGKAEAEAYLAKRGINCYAPCDRYTSTIMPYEGPGVILGGAAVRPLKDKKGAVIDGQPICISLKELIIVQTTHKVYPDQYCDTPYRFFTALEEKYGIKLNMEVVDANVDQANMVVEKARKTGANVVGVRVLSNADKKPVEEWLKEDKKHRAILFHSAAYEPGYSLFFEFPYQVTGQDPKPIFIKYTSSAELQERFDEIRKLWM